MGDDRNMNWRTEDTTYGEDYWNSLDNGEGYQDSMMWVNISCAVKEVFGIRDGQDISGQINILDMGCAYGFSVKWFRNQGFDAWGTDFSEYALEHAPESVKPYLRPHDLTLPFDHQFGPNEFQLVTCFETLEHIEEQHTEQALTHIHNTVKPGGHALVTICVDTQPGWETDPTHVNIQSRGWWIERLSTKFSFAPDLENRMRSFYLFSQHQGVFVLKKP